MAGALFNSKKSVLFRAEPEPQGMAWRENEVEFAGTLLRAKLLNFGVKQGSYLLAFIFVWCFTLVLYLRPNELFPKFFEEYPIPLAKIFAVAAPAIFFFSRAIGGERLFLWQRELKMAFAILGLAVLFFPFSINKDDTWRELSELYIKVVLMFGLLIATLDSRARIYRMMQLTVLCGAWIAIDSIWKFNAGQLSEKSQRIEGTVGGMFSNPNDLATTFGMLLPLAVVLLVVSRGPARALYACCIVLFSMATLVTFSRGGFLALVVVAGVMLWKFRKRHRAIPYVAAGLLLGVLFLGMPGGLGERLWTIVRPNSDATGSAQERRDILKRGLLIAARHPITGIGLGTFHIQSIKERRAHNSYLEIAAELGLMGLLAYLALIFNPLKALWQIEAETLGGRDRRDFENYVLSVGLQATLVAYYANSFFASIQYQWFVYYPLAYAVGLRLIYEREQTIRERVIAPAHLAEFHVGDEARGAFWKARQAGRAFQNAALAQEVSPASDSEKLPPTNNQQLPPPPTSG